MNKSVFELVFFMQNDIINKSIGEVNIILNVMDKIIKEDDAIATIKFKDGISEEEAQRIDIIISKNYDQKCRYIVKIDRNTYKGDMACLSAFSNDVYDKLDKNSLWSRILNFDLHTDKDSAKELKEKINISLSKIYDIIENHLINNDFEWVQGSGYISKEPISSYRLTSIIKNIYINNIWLGHFIRDIK